MLQRRIRKSRRGIRAGLFRVGGAALRSPGRLPVEDNPQTGPPVKTPCGAISEERRTAALAGFQRSRSPARFDRLRRTARHCGEAGRNICRHRRKSTIKRESSHLERVDRIDRNALVPLKYKMYNPGHQINNLEKSAVGKSLVKVIYNR